ncbi:hypothetical protein COOONC_18889 [Cooperia oncophora]
MESVLCHGDLWSMNVLWKQIEDDFNMAAVVDYQTAHFGCAATDLVRVLCACLNGKDRQAHWEQLLEEFYGYLKEEVCDRKMPYSLDQLKEAFRQYFPIGAFMIVPMVGPFFEMVCKNTDEEFKKKSMDIVIEKTECLLDDIFYFHDRNMELRRGEKAA